MVKININKLSYIFDFENFNNAVIKDFKKGGFLAWLIINKKASQTSKKYRLTTNKEKLDINNNVLYLDFLKTDDIVPFIPLKAMFFKDNAVKLKNIMSFSMSTSIHCNGLKYGSCNAIIKEPTTNKTFNLCYGCNFENCRTSKTNINSIEANFISAFIYYHADKQLLSNFINKSNFDIIRYNNHGSFIDKSNADKLIYLAEHTNKLYYGYIEYEPLYKDLKNHKKLIVNGSGFLADNNFNVTTSLQTYFNSNNKCLSDCINCKKCMKKTNKTADNLLHGLLKDIDIFFNTPENINFINNFFNNIVDVRTFEGSYLLYKIKNMLKYINKNMSNLQTVDSVDNIKNYKDLCFYLQNYL